MTRWSMAAWIFSTMMRTRPETPRPAGSGKVCAALPGSAAGPGLVAGRGDVADRFTPAVMRARTGPPSWPPNQP